MILIDKSYHPYFQGLARYIQSVINEPSEITEDYSRLGTWVLNYASHLTRVQDKINGKYIAIQTEQLNVKGNPGYMEFLNNAIEVWDWAKDFKIGYSPVWRLEMEEAKDIDILFYGTMNKRREDLINSIGNVTVVTGYGSEIMKYVMRSKIVLSVHYYPQPENDLPRIAPLLSNKAFVIAEETVDPWFNGLKDHIVIGKAEKLPALCKYYLQNSLKRIEWQDKGYEFIKTI